MPAIPRSLSSALLLLVWGAPSVHAADWPAYRHDAARSGRTEDQLPENMSLLWSYNTAHPPCPAWPTSDRIHFDLVHHPVVAGGLVVFGTSADDRVIALQLSDGRPRWTFFADGPIRFAPAAWQDRLFVASDDGYLYALRLSDGRLLWKHRGGPDDRRLMGNQRMISRWPGRGGPVVIDDTVYYAAGIWPTDGVYLHALDPKTGKVIWTNSSSGGLEMGQPHGGASATSGVAPQGYLVANQRQIFVPTGRSVPAAFDRATGAYQYYHLEANHSIGGARAFLADRFLASGGCLFDQQTGRLAARCGRGVLSVGVDGLLQSTPTTLAIHRWSDRTATDRRGKTVNYRGLEKQGEIALKTEAMPAPIAAALAQYPHFHALYDLAPQFVAANDKIVKQNNLEVALQQRRPELRKLGASTDSFLVGTSEKWEEVIVAGADAVLGQEKLVQLVDLAKRKVRWSHPVEGVALGLAVADRRLIVSTTAGGLYCFGTGVSPDRQQEHPAPAAAPAEPDSVYGAIAEAILERTGVREGLCIDVGCGEGRLATELVRRSKLQVCGLATDLPVLEMSRRRLSQAGLYGTRVTLALGDPRRLPYPAGIADLVVSSRSVDLPPGEIPPEFIRLARPAGGTVCVGPVRKLQMTVRGPLPDAGEWTHQNADPANTLCSRDRRIRGPLEMRWYRDVDWEMTDRHAQGPAPLVSDGVLVAEGVNGLYAVDVYNGRTRWSYSLPGVLKDQDGVHHDVGVGDRGSNFCIGGRSVYVAAGMECHRIDLFSGRRLATFRTPVPSTAANRNWGFLAYQGGLLFGSVSNEAHHVSPRYADIRLRTESVHFFALDACTGQLRWSYHPRHSIRNNAIAIASDTVYLIDRPLADADRIDAPHPDGKHRATLKPGEHPGGHLLALEIADGHERWRQGNDVFGTQLAVSDPHHTILMYYQAVLHNFFRLPSEVGGRMAAFDARTGERRWQTAVTLKTRPVIMGDRILAQGGAWEIATGKEIPFKFRRTHGCGQISAADGLLLFRSATLAYLDLTADRGTENFGGVRPGCWINAIPAAGLVLMPNGSAKCACSYQMQAWLALQPREPTP